jgi:hypothetical protein
MKFYSCVLKSPLLCCSAFSVCVRQAVWNELDIADKLKTYFTKQSRSAQADSHSAEKFSDFEITLLTGPCPEPAVLQNLIYA